MKTVLFYRHFRRFHGGHLKVWDYFNHVIAAADFEPRIAFSPRTSWDETNPWRNAREYVVGESDWSAIQPDVFFVAGRDWQMVDRHSAAGSTPVINYVQHMRHADEESTRFEFLRRKATRICISEQVATALLETGLTEGPLVVIPDGIDVEMLRPSAPGEHSVDLLIVGLKQPALARQLGERLSDPGRTLDVLTERLPRPQFLSRLRRAQVTLFLPNHTEGFYLPALEGMALGTLVVCPDVVGNRSFCFPGHNAMRPAYAAEDVVRAAEVALTLDPYEAARLRAHARETAEHHSLSRERESFLDLLRSINDLG